MNPLDKSSTSSRLSNASDDSSEAEYDENDKVFLSPHTAAFTEECMIRMGKETIQNIIDFFDKRLDKSKIVKL